MIFFQAFLNWTLELPWCRWYGAHTSLMKSSKACRACDSVLRPNTFWNPDFHPEKTGVDCVSGIHLFEPFMVQLGKPCFDVVVHWGNLFSILASWVVFSKVSLATSGANQCWYGWALSISSSVSGSLSVWMLLNSSLSEAELSSQPCHHYD